MPSSTARSTAPPPSVKASRELRAEAVAAGVARRLAALGSNTWGVRVMFCCARRSAVGLALGSSCAVRKVGVAVGASATSAGVGVIVVVGPKTGAGCCKGMPPIGVGDVNWKLVSGVAVGIRNGVGSAELNAEPVNGVMVAVGMGVAVFANCRVAVGAGGTVGKGGAVAVRVRVGSTAMGVMVREGVGEIVAVLVGSPMPALVTRFVNRVLPLVEISSSK